ncbi:944_t:CDS:2 [Dentiscutata erythropus]|uniref:944_t:CDS:1 n=1 Tax=Dentiscutata erythropus TaxID=1348616 RepID=A0A9N8VRL8_9GLOM|nr:944_t:CDS:2 [Dentiscutata erythropus]
MCPKECRNTSELQHGPKKKDDETKGFALKWWLERPTTNIYIHSRWLVMCVVRPCVIGRRFDRS